MNNRLYRSRTDSMIAGVCGGLGRYLRIDSTLVRLFFVLLGLAGNGIGVFIYFLLWIILPLEGQRGNGDLRDNVREGGQEITDRAREMGDELREMVRHPDPRVSMIVGSALVILGGVFLVQNLNLPWLSWLDFDVIWPVLLIVGGGALLVRYLRGE